MSTIIRKEHKWIKLYPNQVLVVSIISGIIALDGLMLGSLAFFSICGVLSIGFFLLYFYFKKEHILFSDYN